MFSKGYEEGFASDNGPVVTTYLVHDLSSEVLEAEERLVVVAPVLLVVVAIPLLTGAKAIGGKRKVCIVAETLKVEFASVSVVVRHSAIVSEWVRVSSPLKHGANEGS